MIFLYIFLILLAAFPLVLTIWRMQQSAKIKKHGVHTNGTVSHIRTIRTGKGGPIDILTITYTDRATGQPYNGKATVTHQRYKVGDPIGVVYLPNKPSKYAIDTKGAYWVLLIFCIILFAFVIFAVYKISEMARTGQM